MMILQNNYEFCNIGFFEYLIIKKIYVKSSPS
jgi:hypothetical protein